MRFQVMYRVPATLEHKTYLSDSVVRADSKEAAIAQVAKRNPTYEISGCIKL